MVSLSVVLSSLYFLLIFSKSHILSIVSCRWGLESLDSGSIPNLFGLESQTVGLGLDSRQQDINRLIHRRAYHKLLNSINGTVQKFGKGDWKMIKSCVAATPLFGATYKNQLCNFVAM
jgi:hypothetical protein